MKKWFQGEWALILGSSSGFGMAAAQALSARGMNIFGVHFDRRSAMEKINAEIDAMRRHGVEVEYFNFNAADEEKRQSTIKAIQKQWAMARCSDLGSQFGLRIPEIVLCRQQRRRNYSAADGNDPGCHGQQPRVLGADLRREKLWARAAGSSP